MSIEQRLRTGLNANADRAAADVGVELQLGSVWRRYHRRRQLRAAGVALAAVMATVVLLQWGTGLHRSEPPTSPDRSPGVVELMAPRSMEGVDGALEPGPWMVPVYAADAARLPRPVVRVPAGYGSPGGWVVDRGADGDPENYGSVSFWTVDRIFSDPCQGTADVEVGPTVDELVTALGRLPMKQSAPTQVSVDGYGGSYLELTLPGRQGLADCTGDGYALWQSDSLDVLGGGIPGTVFRLFVLDVEGHRMVIETDATPHETDAVVAQLLGIARSTHFLPPAEGAP